MMRASLLTLIVVACLVTSAALILNAGASRTAGSALDAETSDPDRRDNTFIRNDWPSYKLNVCREGPIECGLLVW
jgi:hypothetical protein